MERREFLTLAIHSSALALLASAGLMGCGRQSSGDARIRLPYPTNALTPHLSRRTLEIHFHKHHQRYADETLKLSHGTRLGKLPLPAIIQETYGQAAYHSLYNQAAQTYNHALYWQSMSPEGGGAPSRKIRRLLRRSFGGYSGFRDEFISAAGNHFGSGWVWLVKDGNRPAILSTANADTPLTDGKLPLLVIDLWEHAYYLDFQNQRECYVQAFLDHLINWDFFASNWQRS